MSCTLNSKSPSEQVLMARNQRSDLGLRDDEQHRFLSALRAFGLPSDVAGDGALDDGQDLGVGEGAAAVDVTLAPCPLEDLVSAVEVTVRDFLSGRTPVSAPTRARTECTGASSPPFPHNSPLGPLIKAVKERLRDLNRIKSALLAQGETCNGEWVDDMVEYIRGRIEGRPGGGGRGVRRCESTGMGTVRSKHEDLTRLLLRLLPAVENRGGLESRMAEVLQSELWER